MKKGFSRRSPEFVREVFDKHKDKYRGDESAGIPEANLISALEDLGIFVEARHANELFYTEDINLDGWIDRGEFLSMASRVGRVRRVEQWASTLPLAQLLADCMPPCENEADALRAISSLSPADIKIIVACFSQGLAQLLGEEVDKLKRAYQQMDHTAEAANTSQAEGAKYTLSKMSCGGIVDFRDGLNGRIGDPCLDFERAMEAEHCHTRDSMTPFTTRNYGIETCAHNEWRIVVNHDTSNADMRCDRSVPILEESLLLPMVKAANLSRVEVIAVTLYTGPMVCVHAWLYAYCVTVFVVHNAHTYILHMWHVL
jgi:hypothetical protein